MATFFARDNLFLAAARSFAERGSGGVGSCSRSFSQASSIDESKLLAAGRGTCTETKQNQFQEYLFRFSKDGAHCFHLGAFQTGLL